MEYAIDLAKVSKKDIALVGGKASTLGELMQAGFAVPPGFVVTTKAYAAHVEEGGLPDRVRADIDRAFAQLGSRLVAVRSSAVAEDGVKQSWAGVFETFLNVNKDDLGASILRCWQSMTSLRAALYGEPSAMAVLVQAMVPSDVSGVAFSIHPVTQASDQIVIEATAGLGEALVSGDVVPDRYVVEKTAGVVIDRAVMGIPLDSEMLSTLVETVKGIEKHSGVPVDVEWAYSGGKLYVLQARPITTLG